MKSPQIWAKEIVKYMQENQVQTLEAAVTQIETIVGWVQKDVVYNGSKVGEVQDTTVEAMNGAA